MKQDQSSETVTTVTEDNPIQPDNLNEQVQSTSDSQYTDPFSATSPNEPIKVVTEVEPVKTVSQVEHVETVHKSNAISRNTTTTTTRIVYWLTAILVTLLAFRLVLKLLAASTSSAFVALIYDVTKVFIAPFNGIFEAVESGFETSTLVAIIVYALVGWGIAKLVAISTNSSSANN